MYLYQRRCIETQTARIHCFDLHIEKLVNLNKNQKQTKKKNRILTMSINEATGFFFIYSFIFQENRLSYLVHFLISTSIHAVDSLQYNVFA